MRMRAVPVTLVFAAGVALRCAAGDCFSDVIRVSALVKQGDTAKVGIVELATTNSYFVQAGQMAGQIEIVAINYDTGEVTLRRGSETCVLRLSGDPNAPKTPYEPAVSPDAPNFRGEAIEKFLREHPDAVEDGIIKFPLPPAPPAVGKGETIEKFLRENPEAAAEADRPVVGKGEGIEKYFREHPEARDDDTPVPDGSLGSGIESVLKNSPPDTNPVPAPGTPPQPPAP